MAMDRRHFLAGALGTGAALLGASACTPQGTAPGTKISAPPASPSRSRALPAQYSTYPSILTEASAGQTINFWGWDPLKNFNDKIEAYVLAAAGVTTKGRQLPSAEMQKQLQLATQSKSLPDVFKSGTGDLPNLVQIGALADLTDAVAPFRSYLPDSGWDKVTVNGKVVALPANSPAGGMFYRQDVLDKHQIDPESLTTWAAFLDAAKKVLSDSGGATALFGYKQSLATGVQMIAMQLNHAALLNEDLTVSVSPDKPEWQATMQLIKDMLAPGVGKEIPEWSQQWYQAMKSGTLGAIPSGTWFAQTIQQQAPDTKGKWRFTPYPAATEGGDRYVDFGSAVVAVSSQAKQPEAGFELAKAWSIDPMGAVGIGLEQLGISVVSTAALDSEFVNSPQPYFADDQPYWRDATEAYTKITWSPPITRANTQALGLFGTSLSRFYGGQSAADFLSSLVQELKTQIKGVS